MHKSVKDEIAICAFTWTVCVLGVKGIPPMGLCGVCYHCKNLMESN